MANGQRTGFVQYTPQTDNTASPAGKERTWVKTANDLFYYTDSTNLDHLLVGEVGQALDVASLGGSTPLLTIASPVSGLYRVLISISAHTNTDSVTATVSFTDAVMNFATTLNLISGATLTHDSNSGTISFSSIIRASSATSIVVTLTVTAQTTTRASTVVERLI